MKISTGGWKVLLFIIILFIGIFVAYKMSNSTVKQETLKIYQPSDINPKLVDTLLQNQKSDHHTLPFSLINQNGEIINSDSVKNRIRIVDFFFTTCQSICPKMTTQLSRVADSLGKDVIILSHTVDPEVDSVQVLKEYSLVNDNQKSTWHFLTGPKEEIYKLARKSYFVVIDEPSQEGPDFIHTENFVLVDSKGRLRGFYDGTNSLEVDKLIRDVRILQQEKTL